MKKKMITIALCFAFTSALAGCGTKATANGIQGTDDTAVSTSSDTVNKETSQLAIQETLALEDESIYFNPNTPDYGLTLTVKNVSNKGLTLVFSQSGGNPSGRLQTGIDYSIEQNIGGFWESVKTITDEIAWTDEAYIIANDETLEMDILWTSFYGELEAGLYRIRKPFMDFRDTGDFDGNSIYVEFEIKQNNCVIRKPYILWLPYNTFIFYILSKGNANTCSTQANFL